MLKEKGILCPKCGSPEHKVTDKRPSIYAIRRRRECLKCGFRFTTSEKIRSISASLK